VTGPAVRKLIDELRKRPIDYLTDGDWNLVLNAWAEVSAKEIKPHSQLCALDPVTLRVREAIPSGTEFFICMDCAQRLPERKF